jgi:hypothetical protein
MTESFTGLTLWAGGLGVLLFDAIAGSLCEIMAIRGYTVVQAPNSVSMPLNLFGRQRRYFSSRFVPGIELAPRRYNQAIPFVMLA